MEPHVLNRRFQVMSSSPSSHRTNWKVVRNEYETLGTSIKELAASHHTTEALIRAAIDDGGWVQNSLDTDDITHRVEALEARHQADLVPRFIALQTKMLEKCDALLDAVDGIEDANSLKVVSEVIEKHRPAIMAARANDKSDNNITVRILNKVGDGVDVALNAVEITASAGKTNGVGVPHGTPSSPSSSDYDVN
jgi:hypothetical protein